MGRSRVVKSEVSPLDSSQPSPLRQLSAFLNPSALWNGEALLSSMYWAHMALQKGQNDMR